jgi:hypothetical protein
VICTLYIYIYIYIYVHDVIQGGYGLSALQGGGAAGGYNPQQMAMARHQALLAEQQQQRMFQQQQQQLALGSGSTGKCSQYMTSALGLDVTITSSAAVARSSWYQCWSFSDYSI